MGRDERGRGAVILKTVDGQPSGGSNPSHMDVGSAAKRWNARAVHCTWQGLLLTILLHFLRAWRSDVQVSRSTGDRQGCRKLEQCRSNCRDGRERPLSAIISTSYGSRCCVWGLRSQRIANQLPTLRLPVDGKT